MNTKKNDDLFKKKYLFCNKNDIFLKIIFPFRKFLITFAAQEIED